LIRDISKVDLAEWEKEIVNAEERRLQDISVMDILASRHPTFLEPSAPPITDRNVSAPKDTAAEWMRMALDIEEKQ